MNNSVLPNHRIIMVITHESKVFNEECDVTWYLIGSNIFII